MIIARQQLKNLVGIIVLVAILCGILFLLYQRFNTVLANEYEGKIVDKLAGYTHSDEGSFPYYRLLVKSDDGQSFQVRVDYEIYQRAQPGMVIKKTRLGIELGPAKSELHTYPGSTQRAESDIRFEIDIHC